MNLSDMSPEEIENFINSGKSLPVPEPVVESKPVFLSASTVVARTTFEPETFTVTPPPQVETVTRVTPSEPLPPASTVPPAKQSEQSYKSGGAKYSGDYKEDEEVPEGGYQALEIASPAHLLAMFSDEIQSGTVTLHKWQAEVNMELAPSVKPTSQHPLKYYLVAANGSGKDAFVIAPFSIWFILAKIKSRVIITSASGTQLSSQTESYIRALAEKVNLKLGTSIFKIRQRYIRCNLTGSEIRMFATDEAGKAEGYHPLEPNAEMAIIKNESKSIAEDIHKALKRCTGYNYWLEISSPGASRGAFYLAATTWPQGRRVTSYDCPHISEQERESDKIELGENSAEYRSKHLAEFTDLETEVVIPAPIIDALLKNPPSYSFPSWPKRIGIDLAAGGDETSLHMTQGNKFIKDYQFTEKDTTITANRIDRWLRDNGIPKDHEFIFADDGGIGHAVIDTLNSPQYGWNIKRVLNQSAAYNRKRNGNRGAEMWFNVKRIFESGLFDVRGISKKCIEQLSNRKYKQQEGGRLFLQSKRAAKAEGFNSPDRADSLILSFTGLTIEDFIGANAVEDKDTPKRKRLNSTEEVQTYYEGVTFQEYEMIQSDGYQSTKTKVRGSLQVAMGTGHRNTNDKYGIHSRD